MANCMKSVLSVLVLSLLTIKAHCQSQQVMAFLHNFFGQSSEIVYMDKVWPHEIKSMRKTLNQDTLQDMFNTKLAEPDARLVLTLKERSYIQSELDRQAEVTWPSQLFKNGKVLTNSTLNEIYKDPTRGETYFRDHYGLRLYSFSNPIFIRDYSICIFYSGHTCGSRCGEGNLTIFKKKDATWIPWIRLYSWVS
nr:hypothetical protein A6C57_22675 [Fibrella sp. ES10-3-2-2]